MKRWSNRIFALVALLLIIYVFAQDRSKIFSGMEKKPSPTMEELMKEPEQTKVAPAQESVGVREVKTVPVKKKH